MDAALIPEGMTVKEAVDAVLDDAMASGHPDALNAAMVRLHKMCIADETILEHLYWRRDELEGKIDDSKVSVAELMGRYIELKLVHSEAVSTIDDATPSQIRGPQPERLLAGLMLHQYAHEVVPYDEATVLACLDPARPPDFKDPREVQAGATGVLRTASYYVLDHEDAAGALASMPPEQDVLPPLPFHRVWVETSMHRRPIPYLRYRPTGDSEDNEFIDVLGIGIVEVVPRHEWDVYVAFSLGTRPEAFFRAQRIGPHGFIDGGPVPHPDNAALTDGVFSEIHRLAIGATHLITARNVDHEDVVVPRAQRKRIVRSGAPVPKIYYVNLAASGEREKQEGVKAPSGREYSVRWLVRGHWRHTDGGSQWCTCCDPARVASWIEPYVKGPVGAPWKGRQVRAT